MPINVYNNKGPLMRTSDKSTALCGCSSMARISAFQADCVGSIPITRSTVYYAPVAQLDRATAF